MEAKSESADDSYHAHTRYYQVDPLQPDPDLLALAAETIRSGNLVAFPTETVYGLGANALDAAAVAKIFRAKGRPANDPLIVHIATLDELARVARQVPEIAFELLARFSPGPLTLVLKKRAEVPPLLTAGLDTVALRLPGHAVAQALIEAADLPIAAPSANRFSRPSPTCAQHVLDDLGGHVDLILDGGPAPIGLESTIVDLTGEKPQVLRAGGISLEALRDIAPDIIYQPHFLAEDAPSAPAPGAMLRHYSPRAEVLLFRADSDAAAFAAMRARIRDGRKIGLLVMGADAPQFADLDISVESLGADMDEAANRLFAALRALDERGVEQILTKLPERGGVGLAIGDRLFRAAAGRIIDVPGDD